MPFNLSLWSSPAKYNEILSAKLKAAASKTLICKISFGFMF
jgi:hypothetical protein